MLPERIRLLVFPAMVMNQRARSVLRASQGGRQRRARGLWGRPWALDVQATGNHTRQHVH